MLLAPVRRRPTLLALALPLLFAASAAAQPHASIAGRVTDSLTGRPIAGVSVVLFQSDDYHSPLTAVTNDRGRYRFDRLPAGGHLVAAATSAGYLGELSDGRPCFRGLTFSDRSGFRCDGFVEDPPFTDVAPGERREVPFALDLGGAIAGRVTAAATGAPVATRIFVYTPAGEPLAEVPTGADGRYLVPALPAGGYRVHTLTEGGLADEVWDGVHCAGGAPSFGSCDPRTGAPVVVRLRQVTEGIDFELERLGAIAGRVTEAGTGAPLAGVRVRAWRDEFLNRFAVTGADGRYEVAGLFAGEYRVYTEETPDHAIEMYDGLICHGSFCDPAAGTPVPVAIDGVTGGIDLALDPGAAISGLVAAAETGLPLAGVVLWLSGTDGRLQRAARTDAGGEFRFTGLSNGTFRLHTTKAEEHGVADEAFDGVACGLDPAVCAVDGVPIELALGEERAGIGFALQPLGALSGRVTDQATGEPIGGLDLLIRDPRGGGSFALTDSSGAYSSRPLPRGAYFVETQGWRGAGEHVDERYDGVACFRSGCAPAAGTPVAVLSGTTTESTDFALGVGAGIVGRVTLEEDGEPALDTVIRAFDALGRSAGGDRVDIEGRYRLRGLPDGDYYLVAAAAFGLIDEVHDGIQCLDRSGLGCAPLEGAPVRAEVGGPPPGVDFVLAAGFRPGTPCRQSPTRLCLQGGRFEAGVERFTLDYQGLALARPISDSAGAFSLFAADNLEAVVRVIDACEGFDRIWVFAAGLSHLALQAGVRDTVTGEVQFYGPIDFRPALDHAAFAGCGAAAAPSAVEPGRSAGTAPGLEGLRGDSGPGAAAAPAAGEPAAPETAGACVAGPATLCLLGGRFAVEAEWDDGAGGSGEAGAVPMGDRSGYLWFHREGSPEIAVKVLDACGFDPPAFWLFASGLTTSEVSLTVTDTASLEQRTYLNPLGRRFLPVRDSRTFDDCP